MIVYSEDTYSFLNYKDNVADMATIFKVTKITKKMVETPSLGANSVIVWDTGKVVTSGAPKPGGKIYLQNSYVAIDYEDSTEFEIIYSASYKYNANFSQVFPTRHQSTPMARALGVNPTSLIFVQNGCIAKYPDLRFMGLSSDYVAIDSGEFLAYYGVKDQLYFGLPLPDKFDRYTVLGLAKNLTKPSACYQLGSATPGLCMTPAIKAKIKKLRQDIRTYRAIEVDYNLITAFAMPVSDSKLINGAILSVLKASIAKEFLQDKKNLGESIDGIVAGFLLDETSFNNILMSGLNSGSLLEYVQSTRIEDSVPVMLYSDFNAVLEHYKLMYDIAVGNLSVGALIRLRNDCLRLAENMSVTLESFFKNYILKKARERKGWENVVIDNKTSFIINLSSLTELYAGLDLNIKFDATNHEKAQLYFTNAQEIVKRYGVDSDVTQQAIDDIVKASEGKKVEELDNDSFALNFINPDLMLTDSSSSNAYMVGQWFAQRRANAILRGVLDIDNSYLDNRTVKKGIECK